MAELGKYNRLRLVRHSDIGAFLDAGDLGEILLPRRFVDESMQPGDEIEVFVYNDSEDRVVATRERPKAQVGECAYLKVVSSGKFGAFLDWGLPKDLLVPFGEQQKPMRKGYSYVVYLYVDQATRRIAGSTKLENHLSSNGTGFEPLQPVDCLVYGRSDLGFKAVIDGTHLGQFYDNETFRRLHYGERVGAYIKRVRQDGKIDLVLQLPSRYERDRLGEAILEHLRQNQGSSTLTDKSPPDDIYQAFGVSKANYKKALGRLYRQREIAIEKHRITLL
jgi:predicted RNA-binding protein (virulence factor B family)